MAVVMKQQNRAEEAIRAINCFRDRCSKQAQESLDNVLMDLYKVDTVLYVICFTTGAQSDLDLAVLVLYLVLGYVVYVLMAGPAQQN